MSRRPATIFRVTVVLHSGHMVSVVTYDHVRAANSLEASDQAVETARADHGDYEWIAEHVEVMC